MGNASSQMTPVNLNEFLMRHPAMLKLRLQVDEAAVAVKHAHIESLRALSDKNAPLITRWHTYFRECDHGHQIFIGAFYRSMSAVLNLGLGSVRQVDKNMLRRKWSWMNALLKWITRLMFAIALSTKRIRR